MFYNYPPYHCPACSYQAFYPPLYNFYPQPYSYPYFFSPYGRTLRETPIKGKATWTWGGMTTKCNIPWSYNHNMTAAVGRNSPFQCGQRLKVKNISVTPYTEVEVTVVDEVAQYPANKISLHRVAFEALGISPSAGVINVEITPIQG
ncbi:hypothetical protein [Bacillus massilinigeriensis]|uniref:hypothetical protein n=1 Tax=Bacillus massilionigeriensis TaxID=1805475 RepID=UPI00096B6465|nr:hypothetical protein [Bacillus massilionigeriensis]